MTQTKFLITGATGDTGKDRLMIDAIPAMAWSCLPDGSVEFLNRQWLDYTGLSLDTALGLGWKTVIHLDDLEALTDHWQGAVRLRACWRGRSAPAPVRRRVSLDHGHWGAKVQSRWFICRFHWIGC